MNRTCVSSTEDRLPFPFKTSAPAMIYGKDIIENVRVLGRMVDNVEIVLFYTPELNNFPQIADAKKLLTLGEENNLTYSVHLPAGFEIASPNEKWREKSIRMAIDLIHITSIFNPVNYILHVPFTKPTLASVPGNYFHVINNSVCSDWTKRALESLDRIKPEVGPGSRLLLENINYSPTYLQPFLEDGTCQMCLDLGHLLLGEEKVMGALKQFLPITGEIHLHGVRGTEEHIGLGVLPEDRISRWMDFITAEAFGGILNLEVFTPEDLETSLDLVVRLIRKG